MLPSPWSDIYAAFKTKQGTLNSDVSAFKTTANSVEKPGPTGNNSFERSFKPEFQVRKSGIFLGLRLSDLKKSLTS